MTGHRLFVYGTLMQEELLRRLLQRVPPAVPAILANYHRSRLPGRSYPGIRYVRNRQVDGYLLTGLSTAQLQRLDRYEGSEYRRARVRVDTAQGRRVTWVYLLRRPA